MPRLLYNVRLAQEQRNFGNFLRGTGCKSPDGEKAPVTLLRPQKDVLGKIWSFVKPKEQDYSVKVKMTLCDGETEHCWVELLEGGNNSGSLANTLFHAHIAIKMMREDEANSDMDWDNMKDEEFRRRYRNYLGRLCPHCRGTKCGPLRGDTVHWENDFIYRDYTRFEAATEEELQERGYRGAEYNPKHFWG